MEPERGESMSDAESISKVTDIINDSHIGMFTTINEAGALLILEADAVICTIPGETPDATFPLRVATEPLPSDAQVKVIPLIKLLNWSYPTAV